MDSPRIKMSHARNETPPNIFDDFDWARQHREELLEKYGECSIIVYKCEVIGVGATYDEAVEDAEKNLPSEVKEVTPIHERLKPHNPFVRAYPKLRNRAE